MDIRLQVMDPYVRGLHALELAESEQISIPPCIALPKVPVSLLEIQRALP